MDDMQDLRDRAAAYQDGPPPERPRGEARPEYLSLQPPTRWTPEWVVLRLEFAFKVLMFTSGRVGPMGYKAPSTFRQYIPELALVEKEAHDEHAKEKGDEALNTLTGVTPDHITYCDEALSWPARYLGDDQIMRDALMLYCLYLAKDKPVAPELRARKLRAAAMAKKMQKAENARRREARRKVAAATVVWSQKFIDLATTKDEVDAVKNRAHIRFQRAVRDGDLLDTVIRPHEAMPGVVLSPSTLDRQRKAAARMLSERLQLAGVPVR